MSDCFNAPTENAFVLAVIGAGSAGFSAAITAADGGPVTSPAAYTPAREVRICPSTFTPLLPCVSMPAAAKFRLSEFGLRPVAINTFLGAPLMVHSRR